MSRDSISSQWILRQLDQSATEFTFPDLGHGYFFAIDVRLHPFSDRDRWALIVETVGYNPRAGDVDDVFHTYGNCLTTGRPGFANDDLHGRIDNFDDVENEHDTETAAGGDIVVRSQTHQCACRAGRTSVGCVPQARPSEPRPSAGRRGRAPTPYPARSSRDLATRGVASARPVRDEAQ